jgi:DNA-directed RNA polymerase subunit RPC12/RpoP
MSEIIFRCPECSKNLSIDEAGEGVAVPCADCGKPVTVPPPVLAFRCPSCRKSLLASEEVKGGPFQCPECKVEVLVPRDETSRVIDWKMEPGEGAARSPSAAKGQTDGRLVRMYRPSGSPMATEARVWGLIVGAILVVSLLLCVVLARSGVVVGGVFDYFGPTHDLQNDESRYRQTMAAYRNSPSQTDKPDILRGYLSAFPNGRHAEAVRALLGAEDDQLFEYVRIRYELTGNWTNRLAIAQQYLRRFPAGKHVGAANAYLDQAMVESGR